MAFSHDRQRAVCALSSNGSTMMVFGGRNHKSMLKPTAHLLELSTRVWSEVRGEDGGDAAPTRGRSSHSATVYEDKVGTPPPHPPC